jgi:hypothetical protein
MTAMMFWDNGDYFGRLSTSIALGHPDSICDPFSKYPSTDICRLLKQMCREPSLGSN